MPSGYTAPITDNDNYSFEEFIWHCARAFGAFIHMRDDSLSATPTLPEESSYYKRSIKEHTEELARLQKLSLEEAAAEIDEEYEASQKYHKKAIEDNKKTCQRYNKMLEKVKAWVPPSKEHEGLKNFMIEQVTQSMEWDCKSDYHQDALLEKKESPKKWLKDRIDTEKEMLQSARERAQKEHEGHLKTIEWITQLQHSVPMPKKVK